MKKYLLAGCAVLLLAAGGAGAWWKFGRTPDPVATAMDMLKKGDSRGATIELRSAVRNNPSNGEAHFRLGVLQLQSGDAVAGEKELKAAGSLGVKYPELPLLIAQSYLQQINMLAATPDVSRARDMLAQFQPPLAAPALTAQLLILRSVAQAVLKDQAAAQASLAEAERLTPNSPAPQLAAARNALGIGDLALALQKAERALQLDPKRPDSYVLKGQVESRSGNLTGALDSFNAAIALAPNMVVARLEQANLLVQTGQDDKARQAVDSILAQQPNAIQGIYLKAILLARAHDYKGADVQFQRIAGALDRYPRGYYFLGLVKYNLGELEQAVEAVNRYVHNVPGDPEGSKLLARILLADGYGDRATDVLSKAAASGSADAETLDMLGRAQAIAGKTADAVRSFDKAAALAPNNSTVLDHLASAKLQSGDVDGAQADLAHALQLSPGRASSAESLVVAALAGGDTVKASDALATLRQQTGNTETVGLLNGQLLMMQQNFSGARAQFESLLSSNPKLARARFGLAQVLGQQGDPAGAEQTLADLVAQDPTNLQALAGLLQYQVSQGKIAQAITAAETAHKAAPASEAILVTLASLYVRDGQHAKALALLADIDKTAKPADLPELLQARADAQIGLQQSAQARATLGRILAQNPADPKALPQLLALLVAAHDFDAARTAVRQALITKPADPNLLRLLVGVDLQSGGAQAAFAGIARLQADPGTAASARTLKGDLDMHLQHYAEAAADYAAVQKTNPSTELVQNVAKAYALAGDVGKARAVLLDWFAQHPDDAEAAGAIGTMAMDAQQWAEAAKYLEAATALRPRVPLVLNNLAWVYQNLNDPRAVAVGRQAYLLGPSPQTADTLGWILANTGNADEAVPLLTRAAGILKDDPQTQFHLGAALKAVGRKAEAVAVLGPIASQSAPFAEQTAARQMLAELQAAK